MLARRPRSDKPAAAARAFRRGRAAIERDARGFHRIRAGLGSGLELIVSGDLKDVWCNVRVGKPLVAASATEPPAPAA